MSASNFVRNVAATDRTLRRHNRGDGARRAPRLGTIISGSGAVQRSPFHVS